MIGKFPNSTETIIIGAGVIGLSIAFHLAVQDYSDVIVLDKFDFLGYGSSGRSAGGFRQQFSRPEKIQLALYSKDFFDTFDERFGMSLSFKKHGYLLLAQSEDENRQLIKDYQLQRSFNIPVEHLDISELSKRFGYLNVTDLKGANICLEDGYLDPHSLMQAYMNRAREAGIKIVFGNEVTKILCQDKDPHFQLHTLLGTIKCKNLVNAAGAWSGKIARYIGENLPLQVRKRQIFVSGPYKNVNDTPLVIQSKDPFYFRKEGDSFILSIAEVDEIDERCYDEPPFMWENALELAIRASIRVPQFENLTLCRGWAGLRTITPDTKPILSKSSIHPNLFHACGMSGHGVCLSPAVGYLMARLILNSSEVENQLTSFCLRRFE